MTTIRALPSLPDLTTLMSERLSFRSPDPIASGFQSLLQTQARLSRPDALKQPVVHKEAVTTSPRRADIDSMLAQLLASKKMLLMPARSVSAAVKASHEGLAECTMADDASNEISDASITEYVHDSDLGLCEKISRKHPELSCDDCCYFLLSDLPIACQQPFPAVVTAPLNYVYIWISPEVVRAPVSFSPRQPLRIRTLRLLTKTGYRQTGRDRLPTRYLDAG